MRTNKKHLSANRKHQFYKRQTFNNSLVTNNQSILNREDEKIYDVYKTKIETTNYKILGIKNDKALKKILDFLKKKPTTIKRYKSYKYKLPKRPSGRQYETN